MASDYPFIRAYCKLTNAKEYELDDMVRQARREFTLPDVWSYNAETKRWNRFSELEAEAEAGDTEKAEFVKKMREIMR